MQEMKVTSNRDATGIVLGIVTFIVGIVLMVVSFILTYQFFKVLGTEKALIFGSALASDSARFLSRLLDWVVRAIMRLGALFLLAFVASLIAARGAHMYTAARRAGRERE
ncbi:MAG TPA: hypothetical protein EYP10_03100 [Armatimonadetes bacterium]|nr:hypothetical protein [Armatimonadota bacterium]